MCGRFAYNKEKITPWAKEILNIVLDVESNLNVSPSQEVVGFDENLKPMKYKWGIKPQWAKRLIINAQAETVASKPTFKNAFATHRCLVPCSGWYEWKDQGGVRKQKYYFSSSKKEPFLMAGIWYQGDENELVTLTTKPGEKCAKIHKRMPLLISVDSIDNWFGHADMDSLTNSVDEELIAIEKCA